MNPTSLESLDDIRIDCISLPAQVNVQNTHESRVLDHVARQPQAKFGDVLQIYRQDMAQLTGHCPADDLDRLRLNRDFRLAASQCDPQPNLLQKTVMNVLVMVNTPRKDLF